LYSSWKHWY